MNKTEEELILIMDEKFDNPIEVIEQQEKFIEYLTIKVEKLQREKAKLINIKSTRNIINFQKNLKKEYRR
jgi:hypothetical protein